MIKSDSLRSLLLSLDGVCLIKWHHCLLSSRIVTRATYKLPRLPYQDQAETKTSTTHLSTHGTWKWNYDLQGFLPCLINNNKAMALWHERRSHSRVRGKRNVKEKTCSRLVAVESGRWLKIIKPGSCISILRRGQGQRQGRMLIHQLFIYSSTNMNRLGKTVKKWTFRPWGRADPDF